MRVLDLSHPLAPGMAVFHGDPPVELDPLTQVQRDGYRLTRLSLSAHAGTHVDSPAHVMEQGAGLDALDAGRLAGPGLVLDMQGHGLVTAALLAPYEEELRGLAGGFALIRTGWAAYWGGQEYYRGWPHLDPEGAQLLAELPLSGVGLDAPSPDADGSHDLPAHRTLLGAGRIIVENLADLGALPRSGFTVCCAPLPLTGAEAAPARVLALLDI